jgi:hypothetical protein
MIGAPELMMVEQVHANPRQWRNRLLRLAALLPSDAVLTSVTINPDNLTTTNDLNKLVIMGELKIAPGQDRMRSLVQFVSSLHGDSTFNTGFHNIQLASSRATELGTRAEFVIECR